MSHLNFRKFEKKKNRIFEIQNGNFRFGTKIQTKMYLNVCVLIGAKIQTSKLLETIELFSNSVKTF